MRFVIGGKSHELNYETVLEAASQIEPEILDGRHKYYVAARGRRFPVKQLFSQATGRGRDEFITHDAIRNLRKLGFSVENFHVPLSPATDFDAATRPRKMVLNQQLAFRFPLKLTKTDISSLRAHSYPGATLKVNQGKRQSKTFRKLPGIHC